ncbi:MAG: hypothetical protein PHP51_08610 [Desulfotomaculaceae bacterium]|nr:hypothetical protein [Desulfotomaculaceae bacterium]MDD4766869.1 hypothetical protein [Desulfotomaculaceae bacterium]
MKEWLQRFMYGRYGQDDLGRFLIIWAIILWIISLFTRSTTLHFLAFVLLLLITFRLFSRNVEKRAQENYGFLRVKGQSSQYFIQIKLQLRQRKTHRFYRCSSCKQQLRVPRGKGLITIRCPICKTTFDQET